jgi:hypothetical protein
LGALPAFSAANEILRAGGGDDDFARPAPGVSFSTVRLLEGVARKGMSMHPALRLGSKPFLAFGAAIGLLCIAGGCEPSVAGESPAHSLRESLLPPPPASEHCPENAALVLGTSGADQLVAHGAGEALCVVAGEGDDQVVSQGVSSRVIDAGPGNDRVVGRSDGLAVHGGDGDDDIKLSGNGAGQVFAGAGSDRVHGSAGGDYVEGGEGDDELDGGNGRDRLLGQNGDDVLAGGPSTDALVPGRGRDQVLGGPGDDLVVVMHACQLEHGESLDGGSGMDVLLTPLDEVALASLGVEVHSFERILVFPEDGFGCDPVSCACPESFSPLDPKALCDYSELSSEDLDVTAVTLACEKFVDALPSLLLGLPEAPSDADVFAAFAGHDSELIPAMRELSQVLTHDQADDIVPPDAPGVPQPGVLTTIDACDRPDFELHVGIARNGLNNCSDGEETRVRELVDTASFMAWRTSQTIDAVLAAPNDAAAEALWNQGAWNYPLASFFGPFSRHRAEVVKETVDLWFQTLHGDDDGPFGPDDNVQCFHPLKWWQYIGFGLISPATIVHKTVANPCWLGRNGVGDIHAHAAFAMPVLGRVMAAAVFYPFRSIELCEALLDEHDLDDSAERIAAAGVILHEFLHWRDNAQGNLRDKHGDDDDGICPNAGCSVQEHALDLANEAPDVALVSIVNYQEWANVVGAAYIEGFCDDVHDPVCFPSDCCGDGILQTETGEACDGDDFGDETCLSAAGLSEGELDCSADCAAVASDDCSGECGNDTVDPALGEICDGDDLGGGSCADFGFEMGSVTCNGCVAYDTSGCSGGTSVSPPASYGDCGVPEDFCTSPEDCSTFETAGSCAGGPCLRTDPSNRLEGQVDPTSDFHPKGNFRDSLGNLYRCGEDEQGNELTCLDDDGWGACRRCGTADGQTMLGCSCATNEQCASGGEALGCWGGAFPQGGFCWPLSGPPDFQCTQGACGQVYGTGSGSYCEHYPSSGNARCMTQDCGDIPAQECAGSNFICASTYDPQGDLEDNCANECETDAHCSVENLWPPNYGCSNGECLEQ